jgi:hypothetical protein
MAITNLIDDRKFKYRWKKVCAVAEPTWHDNHCKNADQAVSENLWFGYDDIEDVSVAEAIKWAETKPGDTTLFLYNPEQIYHIDAQGVKYDRVSDAEGKHWLINRKTNEHTIET